MSENMKKPELGNVLLLSPRQYFVEMVENGLSNQHIDTYPAVQTYLVSLLEFYLDARNLFDEPMNEAGEKKPQTLAEMLLLAVNAEKIWKNFELLKKLGDRSLYISGFFGDSLSRKIVDIDYYADMGGDCLWELGSGNKGRYCRSGLSGFLDTLYRFRGCLNLYLAAGHGSEWSKASFVCMIVICELVLSWRASILTEMGVLTLPQDQAKLSRQD